MKKKYTIAVCASISFYKDVVDIKNILIKKGYILLIPRLAQAMEKSGDYNLSSHMKTFYKDGFSKVKGRAIIEHFDKIKKSDAILIVNKEKHRVKGYIGPNVLMEMGIAFYLKKNIFILHEVLKKAQFIEEIDAMKPVYLKGNLNNIRF